MTNQNIPEGFTKWDGGENPVPGLKVCILCRGGAQADHRYSDQFNWHHVAHASQHELLNIVVHINEDYDIIAYKVVE